LAAEALLMVALSPDEYGKYERQLRSTGLIDVQFSMFPGGAAVTGRF